MTSSHTHRFATVVALALVACVLMLAVSPARADEPARINPMKHCHDDFRALCVDKLGSSAKTGDLWSCMRESVADIKDDVCRDWIQGMIACEDDARKVSGCISEAIDGTTALRRCLRGLEDSQLSGACLQSAFLQRLRAARTGGKQDQAATQ